MKNGYVNNFQCTDDWLLCIVFTSGNKGLCRFNIVGYSIDYFEWYKWRRICTDCSKRMIEWNEDMDYKLDDEQIETTLLQIVVFFTLVGVFSTIVGILVVPTITCVICIISCGAQIFYALIYKNELIYDIAEDIIVTGILEDDKYIIK